MALTQAQLARLAGLSRLTVNKALNGHADVPPATRARVAALAEAHGYRPSAAARAVRERRTRQVGVLIVNSDEHPDASPQNYYTILGINSALEADGYVLSVMRIGDLAQGPARSRLLRERLFDGVIALSVLPEPVERQVAAVADHLVWVDTNVRRPTDCVHRDERQAGRLAAAALADAGYRRLVYLAPPRPQAYDHYSQPDREAGVRAAARARGVPVVQLGSYWNWTAELHRELLPLLDRDTGVVAYDTFRVWQVAHTALRARLVPGADFGLACCEDTPEIAVSWPDLSRAVFDRREMGRRAAAMMLAKLRGPAAACPSVRLRSRWEPGRTARRDG